MHTYIASNQPSITNQLRFAVSRLDREGRIDCGDLAALPPADAADADLLLLVLHSEHDRDVALLRDWRPRVRGRLVAVGPADAPERILDAIHAGADDYLDELRELDPQVAAVAQRVPQSTTDGSATGRVITVCAACGGGGATLTAANVAVLLADSQSPCGLIDLSHGFGELASLLSLSPRHTLADLCSSPESIDREMVAKSCTPHETGVHLIASGAADDDGAWESAEATSRVLQAARRVMTRVVVDLNCRAPFAHRVLASSDTILLVFPLTFIAACNARRRLDQWHAEGLDSTRIVLVGNRCGQPGEIPVGKVSTLLGSDVAFCLPDDPLAANVSTNCGNPVVRELPKSPLATSLGTLADSIRRRCGEIAGPANRPSLATAPDSRAARLTQTIVRRAASVLFC